MPRHHPEERTQWQHGATTLRSLPRIRQLASDEAHTAAPGIARLINAAYAVSDTGITLSTPRIPEVEVAAMIRRGEILAAQATPGLQTEQRGTDDSAAPTSASGEFVGCIQVMVKASSEPGTEDSDSQAAAGGAVEAEEEEAVVDDVPQNSGLPTASHSGSPVGEFTCLAVAEPFLGRGLGEALVRAAEAHACDDGGCETMLLGVMCPNVPPESEPAYQLL